MSIDWEQLRLTARQAATRAYAPYSGFDVGAAAALTDGRIVSAANVENASYVVGICAETALVGVVVAEGAGRGDMVALSVTDARGNPVPPCGRCRQLLHEMGGPDLLVNERPMREWLPDAFGPDDLDSQLP